MSPLRLGMGSSGSRMSFLGPGKILSTQPAGLSWAPQTWKGSRRVWHGSSCLCWALSVLSLEPDVKWIISGLACIGPPMPDYRVFCARQWDSGVFTGRGRGTLWRVLPWMNGRRPDPLDALSLHNGVIFSRRSPNSLELFHLIKRLPSKTRVSLAKMPSFIHIIYHTTFPKQTSSSLPSWKGYEKEQKTPRCYTMPFQLIIIGGTTRRPLSLFRTHQERDRSGKG